MSIALQHNLLAINSNRQFGITTAKRTKSTEKLSSGYRINRAADDAAGLAISEKMRRQIKGLDQATRNCQDAVSFNQVSDGAMNEASSMLNRMEELAVQAANGSLDDGDREYIDLEIQHIIDEIDHINEKTTFNEQPVFGTHIAKTVFESDAPGAPALSTEDIHVPGKTVGLGAVLNSVNDGQEHYSSAKKLTDPVTFSGGNWVSSGEVKYNNLSVDQMANTLSSYLNRTVSATDLQNKITQIQQNSLEGMNWGITDAGIGNIAEISFKKSSTLKDPAGNPLIESISVKKYGPDGAVGANRYVVDTQQYNMSNNKANNSQGAYGVDNGKAYPSVWMDFSGLGATPVGYTADSLYGLGFNTTCCHGCGKYYTVKFTDGSDMGGAASRLSGTGQNPVLELDVSDCTNGQQLVQKFMNAVNASENSAFTNHYQQYAYNTDQPSKLFIYDNSYTYMDSARKGGSSSFELQTRATDGTIENNNVVVNMTSGEHIVYEAQQLYIQSSVEAGQGFFINRACLDAAYLGINGIGVNPADAAQDAIEAVRKANIIVSGERAMVGAQQNRCEKAILVNMNTAENTTYAESQIRDTNMALEMVEYSNAGILEQAGTAMLSQANQQRQNVLSLLQ